MTEVFRQSPRGVAFRDGKLYRFDTGAVVFARTWLPHAHAWRKTSEQPEWTGCRPEIDVAKAAAVVRKHERLLAAERPEPLTPQEDLAWRPRLPFPTRGRDLPHRRAAGRSVT